MSSDMLGLIEMLLVLGIVLGLAVWQLVSVKRAQRETKDERRE
jgi:type II secretory pathway pseudopilin PulG